MKYLLFIMLLASCQYRDCAFTVPAPYELQQVDGMYRISKNNQYLTSAAVAGGIHFISENAGQFATRSTFFQDSCQAKSSLKEYLKIK